MTDVVHSVHGVPIRLTDERWAHITEEHAELAGLRQGVLEAVAGPDRVLLGNAEERIAVHEHEPGKWLLSTAKRARRMASSSPPSSHAADVPWTGGR